MGPRPGGVMVIYVSDEKYMMISRLMFAVGTQKSYCSLGLIKLSHGAVTTSSGLPSKELWSKSTEELSL